MERISLNDIMNQGLWSEVIDEGYDYAEPYFSWGGCDLCRERTGERLGNDVVGVQAYKNLEDAKKGPDHLYEFTACNACLCAYANGDPFPEEME